METPILGANESKEKYNWIKWNCNLNEMEGPTWHHNLRVFSPVFQNGPCMKWSWVFHFTRDMGSSIP